MVINNFRQIMCFYIFNFFIDIDECNGTNTCDQTCNNNAGSYTCSCFSGYRRTNDVCEGKFSINVMLESRSKC